MLSNHHIITDIHSRATTSRPTCSQFQKLVTIWHLWLFRLRNDLYCVEWGVKLYSLTHSHLWLKHICTLFGDLIATPPHHKLLCYCHYSAHAISHISQYLGDSFKFCTTYDSQLLECCSRFRGPCSSLDYLNRYKITDWIINWLLHGTSVLPDTLAQCDAYAPCSRSCSFGWSLAEESKISATLGSGKTSSLAT